MKKKKILVLIIIIICVLIISFAIPFIIYLKKCNRINNDISYLFEENKIVDVKIENVPLITQDISCGDAIIEMLSEFYDLPVTIPVSSASDTDCHFFFQCSFAGILPV